MTVAIWSIVIAAFAAIVIAVAFINRFYQKATGDFALIRTGSGGGKVVINGGCLVLPFVHVVQSVNLHTVRIPIARLNNRSLITLDKLRVNVEMDFFVKVDPSAAGISTAVQSIGARATFKADELSSLLGAKFIDAMQATAATFTMDDLHTQRGDAVRVIAKQITPNLESSGLKLDSVSLTSLDQAPTESLDKNNAFNAVGLRKLSEIIANNRKQRAEIESQAEIALRQTELDSVKRKLEIDIEEQKAQLAKQLEIEKLKITTEATTAKERRAANLVSEKHRIDTEQDIKNAEIENDKSLRQREIVALLETEQHKIDSQIALAQNRIAEVNARADLEKSNLAMIQAQEELQTERAAAVANREKRIEQISAEKKAQVSDIQINQELRSLLEREQARLGASKLSAARILEEVGADAIAKEKLYAAENTQSDALLAYKLEVEKLDKLPAIAAAVMKPVEKVKDIHINQVSGLGGANASQGGIPDAVNGVVEGVMDLAMRLPAMQKLGGSLGANIKEAKATDKPADKEPGKKTTKL